MPNQPDRRNHAPTVRRRRLGAALRDLRARSGKTREQVADQMEWSESKVYRLEHGRTAASWRDIRDLCDLYGVPSPEEDALIQLARDSRQRGWWTGYLDVFTGSYVGFEAEAASILNYEAELVPGLLQTEPPELSVILNEAVLRRCLASGSDIAAGQLRALLSAVERPNITIRILPFAAGFHTCVEGPFVLLGFPESVDPPSPTSRASWATSTWRALRASPGIAWHGNECTIQSCRRNSQT